MSGQIGALLKAGATFKLAQLRQATSDYVDDRTDHGKSVVAGYAVAAGMYAAAGIFLIATCLVGVAALFSWLEAQYGLFPALGISAGVLLVLTLICAMIASSRLRAKPPSYPSLSTRLGAALKGKPLKSAVIDAKATAKTAAVNVANAAKAAPTLPRAAASSAKPAPAMAAPRPRPDAIRSAQRTAESVLRKPASPKLYDRAAPAATKAGLAIGVGLLGWALVRRRRNEFAQTKP